MSAVLCDRLTLAIGGHAILADVSIDIGEGEFIGLLGPNGAGKTTLLRALLGLVRPAAGAIRILGEPSRRGHPAIGYMPQSRTAPAELRLTGREIVLSSLDGHRYGLPLPPAESRREVERCLAMVGATALAGRPLGELSGGERQRLLLAQALVGRPRLLLLDEPLISLDPQHQRAVVDLVRDLCRTLRITVIVSAHELNQLLGAIDRVLYLGRGQAALGTVEEVINGPVLSRLYGTPIEVVRVRGRFFVLSGDHEIEREAHRHEHHQHHA